jgi:hypothetical protein
VRQEIASVLNRKKLTDILGNGGGDDFRTRWDTTTAADDFGPLPSGTYNATPTAGELSQSRRGTPGYKLTFRVTDGDYAGRLFWHDLWLSPAALPMTKRDLAKFGITSPEQLEQPLPAGIRCAVKVALRRDDDGTERNRVVSIEVTGIDPPDPFAPTDEEPTDAGPGDAWEPPADSDGPYGPGGERR